MADGYTGSLGYNFNRGVQRHPCWLDVNVYQATNFASRDVRSWAFINRWCCRTTSTAGGPILPTTRWSPSSGNALIADGAHPLGPLHLEQDHGREHRLPRLRRSSRTCSGTPAAEWSLSSFHRKHNSVAYTAGGSLPWRSGTGRGLRSRSDPRFHGARPRLRVPADGCSLEPQLRAMTTWATATPTRRVAPLRGLGRVHRHRARLLLRRHSD